MGWALLAIALLEMNRCGVVLAIESEAETKVIDPARSVLLDVRVTAPRGVTVAPIDLRDRVRGFSLAEDYADEPGTARDGSTVQTVHWRLVPEPCAERYGIAPFAVSVKTVNAPDQSFVAGPVRFENPAAREPVTGGMEIDVSKDLPPFSWRLVGWCVLVAALAVAALWAVFALVRLGVRKVREHRMSPIERAWVELDRLLRKGLPGRGRYKDFYVELTMVVRRYVQRKYGIKAPHLTTEEFFSELERSGGPTLSRSDDLKSFLESADMVKFAGVEATVDMADAATHSARDYLARDSDAAGRLTGGEAMA